MAKHIVEYRIADELIEAGTALARNSSQAINRVTARTTLDILLRSKGVGQTVDITDGAVKLVVALAEGERFRER